MLSRAEMFQNARRAGASQVRVTLIASGNSDRFSIAIADDGEGIADPAVLLSFGQNGWNDDLVQREDAAGMGMLSLARRGCVIASRIRSRADDPAFGFSVELKPAHFPGEAEAAVRPTAEAPRPRGTMVTFLAERHEDVRGIREAARLAIFRAMAAEADPRPTFKTWCLARAAGIDIASPAAELVPWRPGRADLNDHREAPTPETADSCLGPPALADLLRKAFFSPSDDAGADSWERQRDDFEQEALHMATRLLVSDDEARRQTIADTIRRELSWIIPRDRSVDIAVRGREIAVTLGDELENSP